MNKAKKKTANELIPGDIFHPGEYIKEEMEARNMNQQSLADKLHLSKSEISLIVHGRRNVTPSIAIKLENVFGIDAEFWMNLQIKYEIDLLKKKYRKSLKNAHISVKKKTKFDRLIKAA